jgi:hypothetical protein
MQLGRLGSDTVDGEPIESLATAPRVTSERVAVRVTGLALRELSDWRLIQIDPDFANFRNRAEPDEVLRSDFGTPRRFDAELVEAFRLLINASLRGDESAVERAVTGVGYLAPEDTPANRRAVVEMDSFASEPGQFPGAYDFGTADNDAVTGVSPDSMRKTERRWRRLAINPDADRAPEWEPNDDRSYRPILLDRCARGAKTVMSVAKSMLGERPWRPVPRRR